MTPHLSSSPNMWIFIMNFPKAPYTWGCPSSVHPSHPHTGPYTLVLFSIVFCHVHPQAAIEFGRLPAVGMDAAPVSPGGIKMTGGTQCNWKVPCTRSLGCQCKIFPLAFKLLKIASPFFCLPLWYIQFITKKNACSNTHTFYKAEVLLKLCDYTCLKYIIYPNHSVQHLRVMIQATKMGIAFVEIIGEIPDLTKSLGAELKDDKSKQ